jgi:hypothetical protein
VDVRHSPFDATLPSLLAAEAAEQVDNNRENHTEDQRCGQGKIDGCPLAAIEEIAGQAANGEVGPAKQQEYEASGGQKDTEENKQFAEFGHCLIDMP